MVGSGGYLDAEDNYYAPLAVRYWWCLSQQQSSPQDCQRTGVRWFSGSEAQSYMVAQLLSEHLVTVVPDYLLIGLAVIFGKGFSILLAYQPRERRKRLLSLLLISTVFYGIFSLQVYLSLVIFLPWLFPSAIFLSYCITSYKRFKHV